MSTKEDLYHCWSSESRRAASSRVIYYLINGENVRVDMVSESRGEYQECKDKIYLGRGTFVSTTGGERMIRSGLKIKPEAFESLQEIEEIDIKNFNLFK